MGGGQHGRAAYFGMDNGVCGLSGRKVLIRVKTMLNQILREIKTAKGPITVPELSRKMGVEPDALEGMIRFLVRKNILQDDDTVKNCNTDYGACTSSNCETSSCVFIAKMPKTYSIPGLAANRGPNQKP